jgi:regulator of nonsense transcripts 2
LQLKLRDSSIKRNTALLRKLRTITDDTAAALLRELRACNCAKYVSEAAQAVAEGKLKAGDVWAAVQVGSELHQTYGEWAPLLCAAVAKVIPAAGAATAGEGGEPLSAMQRRLKLRLLADLLSVGLTADVNPLLAALRELASDNFVRDKEQFHTSLTLLASFAKHGQAELLGAALPTQPPQLPAATPALPSDASPDAQAAAAATAAAEALPPWSLPAEKAAPLVAVLNKACDAALVALDDEHGALLAAERENARCQESRGEVPEAQAAVYERLRKSYEALLRNASTLAEVLCRPPPSYPEDAVTRLPAGDAGRPDVLRPANSGDASEAGPWEDEDQRAFYTSLPELRAMVPAVLLGAAADGGSSTALALPGDATDAQPASDVAQPPPGEAAPAPPQEAPDAAPSAAGEDDKSGSPAFGALLLRLGSCLSRDECEAFVLDFCYLNSRAARKRLVKELQNPRWPAQQFPFLCRIAAGLATVARDVAPPMVSAAEDEAAALRARKSQDGPCCEARCRNASLIAELTKFKLAPPGLALGMLKSLLDDFNGYNVDVAAALLDGCGRYLCRSPESATRANALVDVLGRLKQARNLDARQAALVDGAYLACRPPARGASWWRRKERPPMLEFIRHVVFTRLGQDSLDACVRLLRRLPWTPEHEAYLLKCLLKTHKMRYGAVPCVAALVAALSRSHDSLAVSIVDDTLEAVREDMLSNALSQQQRRVSQARLLGELCVHRLVHTDAIFGALWMVLTHGYGESEAPPAGGGPPGPSPGGVPPGAAASGGPASAPGGPDPSGPWWPACDPPEDCFRVRLMVTLLSTVGPLCDRGPSKAKLDKFLAYFQRYVLSKPCLPLDQAFDVADLLARLRPSGEVHSTFAAAAADVAALEAREAAARSGAMASVEEGEEDDEGGDDEDEEEGSSEGEDEEDVLLYGEGSEEELSGEEDGESEEGSSEGEEEGDSDEGESGPDSEEEADPLASLRQRAHRSLVPVEEADAFERDMAAVLAESGQFGGGRPVRAVPCPLYPPQNQTHGTTPQRNSRHPIS